MGNKKEDMLTRGVKFDEGKIRMDLIDPYAIEELGKVLTFGAEKYEEHNWRKGMKVSRLLAAGFRHMFAFARGESNDLETGLSHIAHAMCCMMFILWMVKERPAHDDRFNFENLD